MYVLYVTWGMARTRHPLPDATLASVLDALRFALRHTINREAFPCDDFEFHVEVI